MDEEKSVPLNYAVPDPGQMRRGIWIGHLAAAMYVVSMFLPALGRHDGPIGGYYAARFYLENLGMWAMALCGIVANALFVTSYMLFVLRCRRGTTGCSLSLLAIATAGAITPPLSVAQVMFVETGDLGSGFYVWCAAAVLLAFGNYYLRVPTTKN